MLIMSSSSVSRASAAGSRSVSLSEVQQHNRDGDCWVAVHGQVYDVSSFVDEHPGGAEAILQLAGSDATRSFDIVHPKSMLRNLPPGLLVGTLDPQSAGPGPGARAQTAAEDNKLSSQDLAPDAKPPLSAMLNIYDLESVAARSMDKAGWNYYSSGADDEITLR